MLFFKTQEILPFSLGTKSLFVLGKNNGNESAALIKKYLVIPERSDDDLLYTPE